MRDVYMLSGILAIVNLVILWTATRGTNQVATSNGNTCVLSGTNVYCWGRGMFTTLHLITDLVVS